MLQGGGPLFWAPLSLPVETKHSRTPGWAASKTGAPLGADEGLPLSGHAGPFCFTDCDPMLLLPLMLLMLQESHLSLVYRETLLLLFVISLRRHLWATAPPSMAWALLMQLDLGG